jgi:hypothetical protein
MVVVPATEPLAASQGSQRRHLAWWRPPSLLTWVSMPCARKRHHCRAPGRSVLSPTETPRQSAAPATLRSDAGSPQTTAAAAVRAPGCRFYLYQPRSLSGRLRDPAPNRCGFCRCRSKQRHTAGYQGDGRIHYPFHPRCGETAVVVRRQRFQRGDVFVVHQLDGTLAHIPCWMMSDAAAHHELRSEPRLPLEQLRDLRIEVVRAHGFLPGS